MTYQSRNMKNKTIVKMVEEYKSSSFTASVVCKGFC